MKIYFLNLRNKMVRILLFLAVCGTAKAQNPTSCASVGQRSNSNGMANSCPNVSGTAYASNFTGTAYATVPAPSKTGNLQFSYSGSNPLLLPYAITKVWLTSGGTTIQTVSFGPAGVPAVVGGNTQVNYCFYGSNLPTAGTLSFQLTNPQTGSVWGICSYDASCNSNCAVVANPAALLPVEYSAFTVSPGPGNAALLAWTTAEEQNSRGFTVQRSLADSLFLTIAFVPSANPGGNSAAPTNYSYLDREMPDATVINYRLREEDLDGQFQYSTVQVLHFTTAVGIQIYGAGDAIRISFSATNGPQQYQIAIFDPAARPIRREQVTGAEEWVISGLTPGALYYVSVRSTTGDRKMEKAVYIW
jgi:hypothetical protein